MTLVWGLLAEVWAVRRDQMGLEWHREPGCGELFLLLGQWGRGEGK